MTTNIESQQIVEPGLTTVYFPGVPFLAPANPIKYILSDPATLPGTVLGGIIGSRFGWHGTIAGAQIGKALNDEINDWITKGVNYAFSQFNNTTATTYQQCTPNQGIYNSLANLGSALNHKSPLAIDLDGDGIESVNMKDGVFFDIKNTGFQNKIGWIKADDGLLAYDKDGNGNIDNVTELFGDYRKSAWDELRDFDSNKDGKISLDYYKSYFYQPQNNNYAIC